jgi:hypothetical protein
MNFPFGGGGYLRLLPYRLTASAIRRLNEVETQPAMVYLHPWEIDPEQPVIPAPWPSRFRHYQNLDSTEWKLTRLLEDFSLSPMEQVLAEQPLEKMLTAETQSTQSSKYSLNKNYSAPAAPRR